ncbi:hypothetical protein FB451DRAFT_767311 [Mycena latifolia]|nr:hypothetical protein FB451DRAFT_767311 [Mycena latifolia]
MLSHTPPYSLRRPKQWAVRGERGRRSFVGCVFVRLHIGRRRAPMCLAGMSRLSYFGVGSRWGWVRTSVVSSDRPAHSPPVCRLLMRYILVVSVSVSVCDLVSLPSLSPLPVLPILSPPSSPSSPSYRTISFHTPPYSLRRPKQWAVRGERGRRSFVGRALVRLHIGRAARARVPGRNVETFFLPWVGMGQDGVGYGHAYYVCEV